MNILSNGELELTIITKSVPEVLSWCRGFGDRISDIKMRLRAYVWVKHMHEASFLMINVCYD